MANEVKFLHGIELIDKVQVKKSLTTAVDTFYISTDASVMYAGGKPYYGAPTIVYSDNKIKLYGDSAKTVELGSVDLTLDAMIEGAKYVESGATEVEINGKTITFSETEKAQLPGIVFLLHTEASSGDTHSAVILPMSDVLSVAQTEIDAIETAVGLNADGTYKQDATAKYTSGASTVADAIKKLDDAIVSSTGEIKVASPNDTITVDATGRNIEVNNDVVTIKQYKDEATNGFSKAGITENELYAADAVIEKGFKVLGGNVGQLTSGTEITAGTTVIELLKQMLVKEADCTANKPTCTLTISPTTSPVEVGTVVTETLTSTYSDGTFTGSAADYGTAYSVKAGCTQGTVTYKRGDTTVTSPDEYTMPEGTTTWSCTSTYGASTVTPKKNNGTDSSQTIAAGTTAKSSKSITAQYKWYLGNTTATSVADIVLTGASANVSDVVTGWTATAGTTTLKETWSSNGKSIFVLVKGILSSFKDNLSSSSLIPNFDSEDKAIEIGGTSTATYKCYLWKITTGSVIAAKEIKMTK